MLYTNQLPTTEYNKLYKLILELCPDLNPHMNVLYRISIRDNGKLLNIMYNSLKAPCDVHHAIDTQGLDENLFQQVRCIYALYTDMQLSDDDITVAIH